MKFANNSQGTWSGQVLPSHSPPPVFSTVLSVLFSVSLGAESVLHCKWLPFSVLQCQSRTTQTQSELSHQMQIQEACQDPGFKTQTSILHTTPNHTRFGVSPENCVILSNKPPQSLAMSLTILPKYKSRVSTCLPFPICSLPPCPTFF